MHRLVTSLAILTVLLVLTPSAVLAYDDDTTHPALTDEVVDFYNLLHSDKPLSAEQKEWLIQGSINEDDWPRWINHFYDPVRKIGWAAESQGSIPMNIASLGAYAGVVPWGATMLPATEWVHDGAMQAQSYAAYGGNRTWEQAIKYFVDGNEKEAYITLGHVIHLLEDMTVPDHSRNDSHAPIAGDEGSPFEDYLTRWNRGNISELNLAGNLIAQNTRPPSFDEVEAYFINAAEYSNKYFFSKDTINSNAYVFPEVVRDDGNFGYSVDEAGEEFLLGKSDTRVTPPSEGSKVIKVYSLGGEEIYHSILDGYFSRLAPKAVLYGAGVVELFHKQANDAFEFKDIGPRVTALDISRVFKPFSFSPLAEGRKFFFGLASIPTLIGQTFSGVVDVVRGVASDVATFTQNIISKIRNNPENLEEVVLESVERIEDLLVGDPTDGIVIDTEEERAQLRALKNQLDDIADQVSDLTYQVNEATRNEGMGGLKDGEELSDSSALESDPDDDKSDETTQLTTNSGGGGAAASPPNFVITEIMYNASGTDDGREWIEIRNDGVSSANPEDIRFLEGGTNHRLNFAQGSMLLNSGAYAVIADDADQFLLDHPLFSGNLFDSTFSLLNDGESLALSFNGNTFHSITYSSSTGAYGDGDSLQLINGAWVAATPTPGAVNAAVSGGGTETPNEDAEEEAATSSPPTSGFGASHVVISEVQVAGADAGDEFIELYNPTVVTEDLSTWSLQYVSGTAEAITSSTVSKKNFLATSSIAAKGFYLIGRDFDVMGEDGYRGRVTPNMVHRTFSLSGISAGAKLFLVASTSLIESETDFTIIDVLDYTSISIPDAGGSFERRAWSDNLCHSAILGGSGEFLGNGCDTDASPNDFEIRSVAGPQNSESFVEPRTAPSMPQPLVGASSLAEYNRDSVSINFAWEPSNDFQSATSTVMYVITNASTSATIFNATSTSFSQQVTEVGRSYSYVIQAFDRDGMDSATSSMTVDVPSFLDSLHFYRDPRASSSDYLVDMYYPQYPFIPHRYSSGDTTRMPVFYLNRAAPGGTSTHIRDPDPIPETLAEGMVAMRFRDCSGQPDEVNVRVWLHDTGVGCIPSGPTNNDVAFSLLEDLHLRLTLASSSDTFPLTESDYLTVAFYDYSTPFWAYGGGRMFSLVASDVNRYYFSSTTPAFITPILPDVFSVDFEPAQSRIITRWGGAIDADTLDNLISYDVNFSTSSILEDAQWISAGSQPRADFDDQTLISYRYLRHVVPGDSFVVGARAQDEFGVTSTPKNTTWQYPSVSEVFSQGVATASSTSWGNKKASQPSEPNVASLQSITPSEPITFDIIAVRAWEEQIGRQALATLRLSVFGDDSGKPSFGNKLSEATVERVGDMSLPTDLAFTFTSPIALDAGTKYWFALDVASYSDSQAYFDNVWKNAVATDTDTIPLGQAGRGSAALCTDNDHCGFQAPVPTGNADWYLKLYLRQ